MTNDANIIHLLRKIFIFSGFTESQLSLVAKRMSLVSFPKGASLYRQNDPSDSLYLILSGSIQLIEDDPKAPSKKEVHKTVTYLNRGDVLGEMSLLTGEPRTNVATATSSTELLVLEKKDFDELLEKKPTLAVHLSRLLSSRLASFRRHGTLDPLPGKIYTLIPALPESDRVVFVINLAIAMTEQTRRKILLILVDDHHDLYTRSLGFQSTPLTSEAIKKGVLHDAQKFNEFVCVHPSGLEILSLFPKVFHEGFGSALFPFLSFLKESYDYALFIQAPHLGKNLTALIGECKRALLFLSPQSSQEDREFLPQIEQALLPSNKLEKVWLYSPTKTQPHEFTPTMRLPWKSDWGDRYLSSGSPYLPFYDVIGQRMMDRLARSLGEKSIGFAMGSGAAFGYSLIGMLRVLEREGIFPDMVSGTSMGALIGALYASGKSPDELEDIALAISRKRLWNMIELTIPRSGLLTGRGILKFLRKQLGDRTFDDLLIPFTCVATDIQSGKEIQLSEGNVAEAVRASLSLPFFFQPYYLHGRYLVDGGLVNPVPTSLIVDQGADIIISANLTSKPGERSVPGIMGWKKRLPHVLRGPAIPEILIKTIYTMQYEIATTRAEISDITMQINTGNRYLWWDLDKAKEIIHLGEATAEENISKIKSKLPFFSDSCQARLVRPGRKSY